MRTSNLLHPSVDDLLADCEEDLQRATLLVWLCHVGADGKLLNKYRKTWWSEFLPERVILCALISSTVSAFVAELCGRLQGRIGQGNEQGGHDQRAEFMKLCGLPEAEQRRIMDCLERQATVVCTFVRADQDARRIDGQNQKESRAQAG